MCQNCNSSQCKGCYQAPAKGNVVEYQTVEITTNQVNVFSKSRPVPITCPHCHKPGFSRTEDSCNVLNCLCCFCTACIPWCLFQLFRGKELCCMDAKHYCPACNKQVGFYNAC
jgi:hypothetical protein